MYKEVQCPECDGTNISEADALEGVDADGNRGVWVTWWSCNDCLTEWYT